jgi:hypothetical protein
MHCNEIWHKKPNTFWLCDSSIGIAWPVMCYCSERERGLKCSVEDRHNYEPTVQKVTRSLRQNEGHLPLVPYCTNQRNKNLYSFLSFPTDCIWPHSPQHTGKKPAPPWNLNVIIRPQPKQWLRIYDEIHIQLQIVWHRVSTYSRSCLKGINLEN